MWAYNDHRLLRPSQREIFQDNLTADPTKLLFSEFKDYVQVNEVTSLAALINAVMTSRWSCRWLNGGQERENTVSVLTPPGEELPGIHTIGLLPLKPPGRYHKDNSYVNVEQYCCVKHMMPDMHASYTCAAGEWIVKWRIGLAERSMQFGDNVKDVTVVEALQGFTNTGKRLRTIYADHEEHQSLKWRTIECKDPAAGFTRLSGPGSRWFTCLFDDGEPGVDWSVDAGDELCLPGCRMVGYQMRSSGPADARFLFRSFEGGLALALHQAGFDAVGLAACRVRAL